MRFVDASVFLHAYLRPVAKKLPQNIDALKEDAKRIVKRIAEGEPVATSLVHISEIANILESRIPLEESLDILGGLLNLRNLEVLEPSRINYAASVEDARTLRIGVNDALACIVMKKEGITEIYSFDTDFDQVAGIERILR